MFHNVSFVKDIDVSFTFLPQKQSAKPVFLKENFIMQEYGGRVLKVGMAHKETGGGNGAAYGRQQRGYGASSYGGGGFGRGNYGSNYNFSGDYNQLGAQSAGYGTGYDNFLQSDGYSGSYGGASFSNGSYDQYTQDNVAYGSTNRGFGGNNQYGGYSSFGFGGAGY